MASNDGAVARFRKVLECSICLELYIEPKMLHCSHEFCKLCLEDIVTFRNDGTATITCPLRCETKTVLSNQETVSDLAASYTTKNILDTLKAEDVARDSPDNDHPECWVKDDCRKPVSMSCCNQVMCKYCYDSHAQKTPVNYLNADEVQHHCKFALIYHPRDHKGGVLCEEHSSICTHFCVDSTFLCMYCLHREHKTHKKNDIETEARLLHEAVSNEIAALEAAERTRTLQVKVATKQVKQILDGYRKKRSSTGKPLLPLEEARLLGEVEEHGKGYITERHKSFMVYNHFYSTSISYFQTMEMKSAVEMVMRREEILKNIQHARSGKQHVTLKLSGLDSGQALGRVDVDIKENTSESMFKFVPPSPSEGHDPDEAAALRSKHRGNDFFKQQKYKEAIKCYTKAIDICPPTSTKELSIFYQNRAAANVQLSQWDKVIKDCTLAVQLNSSNYKAMFSQAKAYKAVGNKRMAYQNYAHGIVLIELSGMAPAAGHIESRDSVLASLCEELTDEHVRKRTPAMISPYGFRNHFSGYNYNVFDIPLTSDVSDSNYAKIMLNMKEAKYEMAMKLCDKEILSKGKHRDRAFLLRGALKLMISDDVGAMKDFREVSELPPNSANEILRFDALLNISVIQWRNDDDEEGCLESLDRASQIDKHNATLYLMKGGFLDDLEQYQESKVNFKLAMSLDPTFVTARINYCAMLLNGRERFFSHDEIENAILETIQCFPDCCMIYTFYARFLSLTGKDQEAWANLDKAIALKPDYPGPYFFKSAAFSRNDPVEAERLLLRITELKLDGSSHAYQLLGKYQIEKCKDAQAGIEYFEKALDLLSPKDELLVTLQCLEQAKASVIISKEVNRNVILREEFFENSDFFENWFR